MHTHTDYTNSRAHARRALIKALKCKTLDAELAHAHTAALQAPFTYDDHLPTYNIRR